MRSRKARAAGLSANRTSNLVGCAEPLDALCRSVPLTPSSASSAEATNVLRAALSSIKP